MILSTVHVETPEAVMVPERALSLLDPGVDRQTAALLLYGIEQGWLIEDEAEQALSDRSARDAALEKIAQRLAEATEQAAQRVADGIVPEGQGFTLLQVGLPDDERFSQLPDTPCLRVELSSLYHEPVALSSLPYCLGVAVCVALQLLQGMFPLLVGSDVLEYAWYEQELVEEAERLARECDLDAMTEDDLVALVESDPDGFAATNEQLLMGAGTDWLLGRLRELAAPPPAAKVAAADFRPLTKETKATLLLQWIEEWRQQGPSLADHPLARWVERVAQVVERQIAEDRGELAALEQPDQGDFVLPDTGIVVSFGEEWEDQSIEYLFEHLHQSEESPVSLMPLDPFALSKAHARLLALAEGTALLESLTVLNA